MYFNLLARSYAEGDLSLVYPVARGMGPMIVPALAVVFLSEMGSEKVRGKFLHGEVYRFGPSLPMMVTSYHPSPRNTNTGVLTMAALVKVLKQAKELSQS